ncbi:DUF2207 family protein [Streptococcus panodentis]|uniref:DUF2207 domain-containing protein n=1 Tax=Streptococcus panodentis TaxID=1581472 RepID=A0ABS5AXP8_9STRE|nr:DUF2207 domain-containing protein [Streptococcus panodentis]MBP2621359.1 DUF2207 domain-containing protein [Streptococcus panodentis]
MKKYLYGLVFFLTFFFAGRVSAVDYDITAYQGDLELHADNTATYTERVSYHFNDSYNGQIVSLGSAGKMPAGFAIDAQPLVSAETNGQPDGDIRPEIKDLGDGYEVKIYNAGSDGDSVVVTVTWQLNNLLFLHKDIAELNWTPISDWDQGMREVTLTVSGLPSGLNQTDLFVHTGYFSRPALIEKKQGDYEVKLSGLGSGDNVELHGYWDRQAFSQVPLAEGSSNYLDTFKQTEAKIARDTVFYRQLGEIYLPLLGLLLLLAAGSVYLFFAHQIKPKQSFPKNARLYEAPQDLAPLVLAANVYSVDMQEVNPTSGSVGAALSFENMVQASLLDLLDRGNLQLAGDADNPVLQIASRENLAEFEQEFLKMAFGSKEQSGVKELFAEYQISEDLYKHKSSADEDRVRQIGNRIKSIFGSSLSSLSKKVRSEIKRLKLFNHYRPLSKSEKRRLGTALALSCISLLLSVVSFFFLLSKGGFVWYYIPLALLALLLGLFLLAKFSRYYRDGILNEKGAYDYHLWTSFSNMLRDIAHLDKTEIEGIILWNRLLVYATLFGYADRVSKVMRLRQIRLQNPSMDSYVQANLYTLFYSTSHSFSNYGHVASTASNFSVSSSGSSGGGFSGGGGGGGGGAF